MEAIRFTFNDFDFIIDTFESTGTNRIIRMVQDAVLEEPQSFDECSYGWMVDLAGHIAPVLQGLFNRIKNKFSLFRQFLQSYDRFRPKGKISCNTSFPTRENNPRSFQIQVLPFQFDTIRAAKNHNLIPAESLLSSEHQQDQEVFEFAVC
jgi:hypothetical protein